MRKLTKAELAAIVEAAVQEIEIKRRGDSRFYDVFRNGAKLKNVWIKRDSEDEAKLYIYKRSGDNSDIANRPADLAAAKKFIEQMRYLK